MVLLHRGRRPTISIKRRLVTSFIYLSLYLIIVSISMYAINKRIDQKFFSLSGYNERFWQLSAQQLQLQEQFQQTLRSRDPLTLERFTQQKNELDTLFSAIERTGIDNLESQTLFRVLTNMHEYRINSMTQLLSTQILSPTDHEEISYLSLQASDMNRIAQ